MRVRMTLVEEGAPGQDAVVTVDKRTTAAEVAVALRRAARQGGLSATGLPGGLPAAPGGGLGSGVPAQVTRLHEAPPNLWVDGRRCAPDEPVGPLLRDGVKVSTDDTIGPWVGHAEPGGRFEVRVCGGPAAGRVARVALGASTLGSGPAATLRVEEPTLPALAARLTVDHAGAVTVEPAPGVTLTLDGEEIGKATAWPPEALLACGDSVFALAEPGPPDAHLTPTDEGGLAYNRPPRLTSPRARPRLAIPEEPVKGEGARLQVLSMLLPLFFGLGMYFMMKSAYMLLFCFMSPAMMFGQWWSDRRHGKKRHRTAVKEYKAALAAHEEKLTELSADDQARRREGYPDPAQALLFATGPRRRLWERRITDVDALHLRVGLTDLPAELDLVHERAGSSGADPDPPVVASVPLTLPLTELGVVGVAGDRERAVASARWLAAQAAILHSPRDLSLVVLSSAKDAAERWEWAHWLPHAAPRQGQGCVALLGTDGETVSRRISEVTAELERRQEAARNNAAQYALRPDAHILLVLDGARLLRRVPGVPRLLQEGPAVGIYAICVDEDQRVLPEECRTAVCWPAEPSAHVRLFGHGYESAGEVLADQVSTAWCTRVARALAPVRDISRDDADAALPTAARLLDLVDLPDPEGKDVAALWRRGGSTTSAVIGVGADGPFVLDIRRDGPHALIAGTTGAGKSELLQTMIASLALNNTPDSLNFVLIDYKGGSAFQDCARLPHTVGMVSDLDAHLTERALDSLAAELRHREEILFHAATKDIEDYNDARRLRPELEAMPRLMLVIDEFASLVAELPDFVAGLVDIARRGRSLGVHLVLATQRPAGVVSQDIRANTNLRIALRVTNAEESRDVIEAPDSALISKSTPGRCYVRSGSQSLTGVQSARIGGRRPGDRSAAAEVAVRLVDWTDYGRPLPGGGDGEGDDGTMVTDLAVLVDAIAEGARLLGCPQPRKPWLEPIPEQTTLDELPDTGRPALGPGELPPLPFGITDLPARQAREVLALDLLDGEQVMVAGGPRSGRSTVLRTLAGSLARTCSPEDVHLYGIDCGANALLPLTALPHCGAVVTRDETARVDRLLGRLLAELARRQTLLAERGQSSAAEQRASAPEGERLPVVLVLVDGWDAFRAAFENYDYGRLVEGARRLFREGAALGIKVVLATDRTGLSGDVSASFGERLVLRLTDVNDYALAGIRSADVPSEVQPGRILRPTDEGVRESQVALLAADRSGQAQVAELQRLARAVEPPRTRGLRPLRVDILPTRIDARAARELVPDFVPPAPLWALFAVGGDELEPLGMDLDANGPGFVVTGPPRSGRSSTLVTAARSLLSQGTEVLVIAPRRSPLRELAGEQGVLAVLDGSASSEDLKAYTESASGAYVIVVDDAELLYDTALDETLEELLKEGMDGGLGLIAAGASDTLSSQYRGFVVQARRSRNGLMLSPSGSQDGEMFGVRVPANSGGGPTGRGLFVVSGELTPAQAVLP
ncbi:FtsK/SpoIIIE domain-containing protein [Streptomyces sp. CA-253872]|uniref:FtsK/SpoIIIE domain-containing protein n=1 Tax=Streptomyces sp. CA-253872 TaxID=3240067 RepID=UPI003D8A1F9F